MHWTVKQQYATNHQGFYSFQSWKYFNTCYCNTVVWLSPIFQVLGYSSEITFSCSHLISSFLISIWDLSWMFNMCPFSTCAPWICFCKTKEFCLSEREVHRKWIRRCHWPYTGWRGWQRFSRYVKDTLLAAGIIELQVLFHPVNDRKE